MKWVWLLVLTGCASIKSVRAPELEQTVATVTVGEPLEPAMHVPSPYWVLIIVAALLWFLLDKE